jgi:hypothetical protein
VKKNKSLFEIKIEIVMKNKQLLMLLFLMSMLVVMAGCIDKPTPDDYVEAAAVFGGPCKDALSSNSQPIDPSTTTSPPSSVDPVPATSSTPAPTTTASVSVSTPTPVPSEPVSGNVAGVASNPCPCAGICELDSNKNQVVDPVQTAIPVTFYIDKGDPSILVLTFNKNDMAKKQAKQMHYFKGATTYKFDATFSLDRPIFKKLKLPASARITPKDTCTILEDNGKMTMRIRFSHG